MIQAGDMIIVDGSGRMSRVIKRVLSKRGQVCHTSHTGIVYVNATGDLMALNAYFPYARKSLLRDYLESIVAKGGRWAIVRPTFIRDLETPGHETAHDQITKKRKWLSWFAGDRAGQYYPLLDLWCIFKRRYKLDRFFKRIKMDRTTFYCSEMVRDLYESDHYQNVMKWILKSWTDVEFVAPVHTQIACQCGELSMIQVSHESYWRDLTNQ